VVSPALAGAGLGLLAGVGLVTAVAASPPLRRPKLDDRLAPYLREAAPPSRLLADRRPLTPFPTVEALFAPYLRRAARGVDRLVGGSSSVRRRLAAAGLDTTLEQFRAEQVVCGGLGLGVGLLAVPFATLTGHANPVAFLVFCLICAAAAVLGRDHWLSVQVRRREQRLAAEFPTVAELLALAVSAGESPLSAVERVARLTSGAFGSELQRLLADVRSGTPLAAALDRLAARSSLPAITRFADAVAVATERGTPLADVLRAQAVDAREAGKRALLEAGGRKDIAMLVPVVFLILPVVVLFALFPGFYTLHLAAP
jgi:tight adherence protein C